MSTTTVVSETIQVVTFTITGKSSKPGNYAVPIEQVKEIRTVDAITKIPRSKDYVKGIMNLRGKIIPIVDVNEKIGVTNTETDSSKQRILVADVNDTLTGLLVDEVNEVQRLSLNEIEAPPDGSFEDGAYIKGIANIKDRLIVLLDVSKFLSDSAEAINDAMTSAPGNTAAPEVATEETTATPEVATEETTAAPDETPSDDDILPEIDAIIKESQAK
ncbi:MAG: chemotaxis protein [Thaumarchaeota archaeon]|nr:MAG: chemotaxis protein [Nitrososphaerota archaeon]